MIRLRDMPPEWADEVRAERRAQRAAAQAFADACAAGDPDGLLAAANLLNELGGD